MRLSIKNRTGTVEDTGHQLLAPTAHEQTCARAYIDHIYNPPIQESCLRCTLLPPSILCCIHFKVVPPSSSLIWSHLPTFNRLRTLTSQHTCNTAPVLTFLSPSQNTRNTAPVLTFLSPSIEELSLYTRSGSPLRLLL